MSAIVTGASSGIGAAYARRLAQAGQRLVVVGRRNDRLAALAEEIQLESGVSVETLAADLSRDEGIARVERRVAALNDLDVLVNAAGFVTAGRFGELSVERHLDMVSVHVIGPVRLARAGLAALVERRGALINVASVGAFLPTAGNATYAGTKAYLVAWTRALHRELRGTGVRVQALCPGFTRTEIYDTPELRRLALADRVPDFMWRSADDVVSASQRALERGEVVCIPGWPARLLVVAGSIGLMPLLSAFVERTTLDMDRPLRQGRDEA